MIPPSFYILLCCALIHTQALVRNGWAIAGTLRSRQHWLTIFHGLTFLLYPLTGWLADACFSSFKMVQRSFIVVILGSLVMIVNGILLMHNYNDANSASMPFIATLSVVIVLIGLGMFEANAIQFGINQMMDASSEQLSSFIHWYFWCTHFGPLVVLYGVIGSVFYMNNCKVLKKKFPMYFGIGVIALTIFPAPLHVIGYLITRKSSLFIHQPSAPINPLKIIYQVLQYAYHHKQPVRRSAMTYWEDYMPSRIDLGKDKYGGPFTYEQVEDVKTFLRLMLLILSLFGFHLLGDGYSLSYYIMKTFGCPSEYAYGLIIGNPNHFTHFVVVTTLPMFQWLKKRHAYLFPNMLTKLKLGLLAALITQTLQVLYSTILQANDFPCEKLDKESVNSVIVKCLLANVKLQQPNNQCEYFCETEPIQTHLYIVYLSIIPFMMYGVTSYLVSVTMLEFICAQAPNSMKGLLIGVWYSTWFIKYMINILDTYPPLLGNISWNIYNGVKGVGILVSIVIFCWTCSKYRYRERNEVVNEQAIIEEQYERELLISHSSELGLESSDNYMINVNKYT